LGRSRKEIVSTSVKRISLDTLFTNKTIKIYIELDSVSATTKIARGYRRRRTK
jgi:hypothetical protein